MTRLRKIMSILFLSVYGIILAHNIIPHEHHSDHDAEFCHASHEHSAIHATQISNAGHYICEHDAEGEVLCHFSVELILSSINITAVDYIAETTLLDEPVLPEQESKFFTEFKFEVPQTIIKEPSGLRAPPTIS